MPVSERWRALTHWIVVTTPTLLVETYAWTYDDGSPGPRTAEEAAERALRDLRDQLEEHAHEGAAAMDEIEVLVFERGNESGRFRTHVGVAALEIGHAKDWMPEERARDYSEEHLK